MQIVVYRPNPGTQCKSLLPIPDSESVASWLTRHHFVTDRQRCEPLLKLRHLGLKPSFYAAQRRDGRYTRSKVQLLSARVPVQALTERELSRESRGMRLILSRTCGAERLLETTFFGEPYIRIN